jgi:archaetidylinositol phosphate synthase
VKPVLTKFKEKFSPLLAALARPFLGLDPNAVTLAGLVICAAGYIALLAGYFAPFVVAVIASSLADAIDGYVARARGRVTKLGAFLDSVSDRVEDVLLGAALLELHLVEPREAVLLVAGFLLVSYTRSRGESLGVEMAGVGLAERGERLALILLTLLIYTYCAQAARVVALVLLALTYITVLQRVVHAARTLSASQRA